MKYRWKDHLGVPKDLTVEDTWERIAHSLAQPETAGPDRDAGKAHRRDFYSALEDFKYIPAGRIVAGAGTARSVTLFNCFVMGTVPDSIAGIFDMLKEAALTMQQGGGIGYDFSTVRPKSSWVKGVDSDASGPISFMHVWDAMCRTIMSAGSRRGAMMGTMRCDHPDVMDFITAKVDPNALRMFNLSVLITNDFMKAVREDRLWPLVHITPPKILDKDNSDALDHFDLKTGKAEPVRVPTVLDNKGRDAEGNTGLPRYIHRYVNAKDIWEAIMESTYRQAEPGVIFIDRINSRNNLRYCELIAATNPCGEQPLPPYGACLLGSLNLAKLVQGAFTEDAHLDIKLLRKLVATAVRMMDNVVDVSNFPLPMQKAEALAKRRIGLGVTGVADALAMVRVRYGSPKGAKVLEDWMREIDHAAYWASVELAKEKGPFPLFDADEFLAEGTHASTHPTELKDAIREHGIRNALLTSIAPTGTISLYAGNVSSGIEPIFAYSYTRKILQPDGTKTEELVEDYAVAEYRKLWLSDFCDLTDLPNLEEDWSTDLLPDYFVVTDDLTPAEHIKMQAAAQRHVDSSISKTVNVPEDISFEDFKAVYDQAWDSGCKGCTTYRPNEVTGSVLTVTPKKEGAKLMDPRRDITDDELRDAGEAFLRADDVTQATPKEKGTIIAARHKELAAMMQSLGVARAREVTALKDRYKMMTLFTTSVAIDEPADFDAEEMLGTAATVGMTSEEPAKQALSFATANLQLDRDERDGWVTDAEVFPASELPDRPESLSGHTYKIEMGENKPVYLTVSDIEENGKLRPFEIFLRSSDPRHDEWMVVTARLISAIYRRPHESGFVAEEMMRVHSANSGGFWRGRGHQPSLVAAIGRKLKEHAEALAGALPAPEAAKTPAAALAGALKADAPKGQQCGECHGYNVRMQAGCPTCADCGYSKCG
jgi:ribonucleoside-diphosphate reductase alpha chain